MMPTISAVLALIGPAGVAQVWIVGTGLEKGYLDVLAKCKVGFCCWGLISYRPGHEVAVL